MVSARFLVLSVLRTCKVSSDIVTKLNLDMNCKSKNFHFIYNNSLSMNFLYRDGYIQVKNYLHGIFILI